MKIRELAQQHAALGFTPRTAVRWLSPMSLARTALKVMAATVFADFGDKRELEGSFPSDPLSLDELPVPGQPAQPTVGMRGLPNPGAEPAQEIWLDFTADLGDGFDATYTVASLLAQDNLSVGGLELPRGRLLVLGGDEVYPVASPAAYEDRMAGPYRMALPARLALPARGQVNTPETGPGGHSAPLNESPILLALPGNHDWYDGLTSFIRIFTRQRTIGRWRTMQTRSYFAVRLTGRSPGPGFSGAPGWWLLGLDSQLGQYIDEPQLDYFYRNVTSQLQAGDAIILCLAAPFWVKGSTGFRQANFFEQDYLRRRFNPETQLFEATGATVRLWLSGDLHHYARYEQCDTPGTDEAPDPRRTQMITCGLGGAYLSETHWLPTEITLPPHSTATATATPSDHDPGTTANERRFALMPATFPGQGNSRLLGPQLANPFSQFWLPVRNPGLGTSLGLVHVVAALTIWTVFSAFLGESFIASLRIMRQGNTVLLLTALVFGLPVLLAVFAVATRVLGLAAKGVAVFIRGALYQLSALALSAAVVVLLPWPVDWPAAPILLLVLILVYLGGWALGSEAFALFILATPTGEVSSWKMSGQAIEDHKGFLRIRLAADGSLTVYPLMVDTVCRDWQLDSNDDGVRLVPATGPLAVRLLEEPITIARKGTPP
ncbi:hypothetical protein [Paenarthrobacter histidinolovorans]|uniref:Calcineurin-like phosphoesterase domain-containing protein n=1 Tax=Paenarthrobacter histidinolovorans TaxID=43664 RepID=A0ABW8N8Q4_9MICC